MRAGFAESHGAGRLGSLSATLGAGSTVQLLGALAGFVTVPILVQALGSQEFGVLVVVVSLAPWLTVVDGALYPATRLLVGESRDGGDALKASPALLRSALRLAFKIASVNLGTLVVSVVVLPLVALFGSRGIADREELVLAILAFSLPIVASGPGGIYPGALEGVGRTVVAAIFAGIGPLVALPLTLVAVFLHADLVVLCAIQGCAVALSRTCAWIYWHLRPSLDDASNDRGGGRLRVGLIVQMVALSAAVLIQTGLDPVIVSSELGAEQAGVFGVANRIVTGALIPLVVLTPLFGANLAAARASGWSVDRNHELRRLVLQAALAGLAVGAVVAGLGPVAARLVGAGQVAFPLDLYLAGGVFVFATFLSTPLYLAFSGPSGLRRSVRLNVVLVTVNVALSLVLVRTVGPAGPLWASALAGLGAAGFWLAMWRRHPEWLGEVHPVSGLTGPGPAGPLP
jgi:O-antigen/teichoic acid export membrane protein